MIGPGDWPYLFGERAMIKSKRKPIRKAKGASKFRHEVGKTHRKNMRLMPHRGGFRL